MKSIKSIVTIIVLFVSLNAFSDVNVEKGTSIVKLADSQPKFEKVKGKVSIEIYGKKNQSKPKFTMVMRMAQYVENIGTSKEIIKSISRTILPPDSRDNSYMAIEYKDKENLKFVYMKGLRKPKKVAGPTKKMSFFGSDFTNNDMGYPDINEGTYKYLGMEKVEFKGKMLNCHVIEALPKTDKIKNDNGYGRKVVYMYQVNNESFLTIKLEYWNEKLEKLKVLKLISFTVKKNKKGEKVFYTTGIEMKSEIGTKTILKLTDLKFENEAKIRTDIFTEQYLEQRWW